MAGVALEPGGASPWLLQQGAHAGVIGPIGRRGFQARRGKGKVAARNLAPAKDQVTPAGRCSHSLAGRLEPHL